MCGNNSVISVEFYIHTDTIRKGAQHWTWWSSYTYWLGQNSCMFMFACLSLLSCPCLAVCFYSHLPVRLFLALCESILRASSNHSQITCSCQHTWPMKSIVFLIICYEAKAKSTKTRMFVKHRRCDFSLYWECSSERIWQSCHTLHNVLKRKRRREK